MCCFFFFFFLFCCCRCRCRWLVPIPSSRAFFVVPVKMNRARCSLLTHARIFHLVHTNNAPSSRTRGVRPSVYIPPPPGTKMGPNIRPCGPGAVDRELGESARRAYTRRLCGERFASGSGSRALSLSLSTTREKEGGGDPSAIGDPSRMHETGDAPGGGIEDAPRLRAGRLWRRKDRKKRAPWSWGGGG